MMIIIIIIIKIPISQYGIYPAYFLLNFFHLLTSAFTNQHQFEVKLLCSFSEPFFIPTASNSFIKVITWQILIFLPVACKCLPYSDPSQFVSFTDWFWHTCQVAYGESWLTSDSNLGHLWLASVRSPPRSGAGISVRFLDLILLMFMESEIYQLSWQMARGHSGVMKTLYQPHTKLMKPYLSGHPLCQTSSSIWS